MRQVRCVLCRKYDTQKEEIIVLSILGTRVCPNKVLLVWGHRQVSKVKFVYPNGESNGKTTGNAMETRLYRGS